MPHPTLQAKRIALAVIALFFLQQNLFSQTAVTGFYTNFNGFWKSESTNQNPILPDSHHYLLGFAWNGKVFSTGVSDYSLFTRGISYTTASFRSLTPGVLPLDTPSTRLLLAGDSFPPSGTTAYPTNLLVDGIRGLDLGSTLSGIAKSTFGFSAYTNTVRAAAIGDSIPDILFTQMANFVGSADRIYFVNQFGQGIGRPIFPGFLASQTIGKWKANSFDLNGNRIAQDTEQPMMAMAADLSDFGITAAMVNDIYGFRYDFNGFTSPAFIAFNTASIGGPAGIVAADRISTQLAPACCGGNNSKKLDVSPYVTMVGSGLNGYYQQAGVPVTVSILSGPANHGPLTGATTELTNAGGEANFRNMFLPCEEGTYVLAFNSGNFAQVTSPPITVKTPVYYPVSSGFNDLSKLSNWRNSPDGFGLPPTDFGPGQIFMLSNSANHIEFRTGGNWTVGGRLIMPTGSRLTINGGSTLKIQCTIENSGRLIGEPGSWLEYNGSARQNISGNFELKSLAISNPSSVRMQVPLAVDTLKISAGRLLIDDNDIFMKVMAGGSPTTFVRTEGKGRVLSVVSPDAPKQFQVGNVYYNPATVNIQAPYSDTIAVRVLNEVRVNGTSGDIISQPRITATWNIESSDARAGAAAAANGEAYTPKLELGFELQYSGLQNTGMSLPALYAFDGAWKNITTRYGTCNFPCSYPQIRGFRGTTSLFYLGEGNVALPVSFEKFTAELVQNNARLTWQTAHEYNIRDYSVMYSSDGLSWKVAGNVALSAARNYSFAWNGLVSGKNYFRIRENDKDGNYSYSAVRVLELNKPTLVSVSNPVIGGSTTISLARAMELSLFDPAGRLLWKKSFSAGSHRVDLSAVQHGIYLLKYEGGVSRLMVP